MSASKSLTVVMGLLFFVACGKNARNNEIETTIIENSLKIDTSIVATQSQIDVMSETSLEKMTSALRRDVVNHLNNRSDEQIVALVMLKVDASDAYKQLLEANGVTVNQSSRNLLTVKGTAPALVFLANTEEVLRMDASMTRDPLND